MNGNPIPRLFCGWLLPLALTTPGLGIEPQPVSFQAPDGFSIFADFYPPKTTQPPAPMAVLLHMYKGDRTAWAPLVGPLHDAGFAILALDLRGHGESATDPTRRQVESRDTGLFEQAAESDLRGAYDWLVQQPGLDRARFALVGASVGGSIALRYAAKDRSVDAVVCMTPGLEYLGLDSRGDLRQIKGRKVLLLATEDERAAADALEPLSDGTRTRIYPDAKAHGTRMFGAVYGVEREIVEFLTQGVGDPPKSPVYASIEKTIYHLPGSGWIAEIPATNLRQYSSAAEAEARGLRAARSSGPRDDPRRSRNRPRRSGAP